MTTQALPLKRSTGAWIGGSAIRVAVSRLVVGGALALAATFVIGSLLGSSGVV